MDDTLDNASVISKNTPITIGLVIILLGGGGFVTTTHFQARANSTDLKKLESTVHDKMKSVQESMDTKITETNTKIQAVQTDVTQMVQTQNKQALTMQKLEIEMKYLNKGIDSIQQSLKDLKNQKPKGQEGS